MSKSSGIMKIDSPGKLGPGLNIDQDAIRKQILAAKQVLHTYSAGLETRSGSWPPIRVGVGNREKLRTLFYFLFSYDNNVGYASKYLLQHVNIRC